MPPPLSSATTIKRIHREIADLKKEDLGEIKLEPSSDSLFLWTATIPGPEGSVYEGGVFQVDIQLAHDYPFSAPRMTFKTRIYHMNISDRGGICIDILKHNWSPALSLFKVVLSLSSLLTDPNPKDPLVPSIATEFVRNREQHDRTARHWTELYAKPRPPPPLPVGSSKASSIDSSSKGKAVERNPPTDASNPIVVEDSDDEKDRAGNVRSSRQSITKRKRDDTTIDLTDQEPRARRRPRTVHATSPREVDGVIIIDDD